MPLKRKLNPLKEDKKSGRIIKSVENEADHEGKDCSDGRVLTKKTPEVSIKVPRSRGPRSRQIGFFNFLNSKAKEVKPAKFNVEFRTQMSQVWAALEDGEKEPFRESVVGDEDSVLPHYTIKSRLSTRRFMKIVGKLSDERHTVIEEIGFGSLRRMANQKMNGPLCRLLIDNFKPIKDDRAILKVHGQILEIGVDDFERVMGIKNGGHKAASNFENENRINELKKQFCGKNGKIWLHDLENWMKDSDVVDDNFLAAFMLFCIGMILCPTSGLSVSFKYLPCVVNKKCIMSANWAELSLTTLIESHHRFVKNQLHHHGGCLLFLLLFYYDAVCEGVKIVDKFATPITVWGKKEERKLIRWLNDVGGFNAQSVKLSKAYGFMSATSNNIKGKENEKVDDNVIRKVVELNSELQILRKDFNKAVAGIEGTLYDIKKGISDFKKQTTSEVATSEHPHEGPIYKTENTCDEGIEISAGNVTNVRRILLSSDEVKPESTIPKVAPIGNQEPSKIAPLCDISLKPDLIPKKSDENVIKNETVDLSSDTTLSNTSEAIFQAKTTTNLILPVRKKKMDTLDRFISQIGPFSPKEPLPDIEFHLLSYIFAASSMPEDRSEIILRTPSQNLGVTRENFICLAPTKWLWDHVIDPVVEYLTLERNSDMSVLYLETWFAGHAIELNQRRVDFDKQSFVKKTRRWTSLVEYEPHFEGCHRIFIPINDDQLHWFLTVINIEEQKVEIWDSLKGNTRNRSLVRCVVATLDIFFQEKNIYSPFSSFEIVTPDTCPIQPNGFDCGVFLINHMRFYRTPWWKNFDSQMQRMNIAIYLVRNKFNLNWNDLWNKVTKEFSCLSMVGPKTALVKPVRRSVRLTRQTSAETSDARSPPRMTRKKNR